MSSGVAYGINRIIVDNLEVQKCNSQNYRCPSFTIVSSDKYRKDVENAIEKEYASIEQLNSQMKSATPDEKIAIEQKVKAKTAKVDYIKQSGVLNDDVIDVKSFDFVQARTIDPMLKGLIAYIKENNDIKTEPSFKKDAPVEEIKKAKADAIAETKREKAKQFKQLVRSLGIDPIENRKDVFVRSVNKIVKDEEFWSIKLFNQIFDHPEFESASDKKIKHYLTRAPINMNSIIFEFNGSNGDSFVEKYCKSYRIDLAEAKKYIAGDRSKELIRSIGEDHCKNIMGISTFVEYFAKHKATKEQIAAYKSCVNQYKSLVNSIVKKHTEVTDDNVVDYYVKLIEEFSSKINVPTKSEEESATDFGLVLMNKVDKMIPIRFGNAIRVLTHKTDAKKKDEEGAELDVIEVEESKTEEAPKDKMTSAYESAKKAITSVDDIFFNKTMYFKIGKSVVFAEDRNERIAYGMRIIAEIQRQIDLICATHATDNFNITIIAN